MNKYASYIFFGFLSVALSGFLSCVSTEKNTSTGIPVSIYENPIDFSSSGYKDLLVTLPVNENPMFFASVQRMNDRDQEATAALLSASEQASKYIAVKATSKFYSEKLNFSLKYMRDLNVLWDKELALEMIDRLEVISISQDTYGTYLTSVLPDEKVPGIVWRTSSNDGKPGWTNRIPTIPGYIVSVGIALQTGYVSESFTAADNQALEDLARQISVEIVTGRKQIENARGTAALQTNYEISEVVIPGFYILERWRTPDARYYYSLAVAPDSIIQAYRND